MAKVKALMAEVKNFMAKVKTLGKGSRGERMGTRVVVEVKDPTEGNKRRGIRRKYPGEGRSDGREQVVGVQQKGTRGRGSDGN